MDELADFDLSLQAAIWRAVQPAIDEILAAERNPAEACLAVRVLLQGAHHRLLERTLGWKPLETVNEHFARGRALADTIDL